MAPSARRDHEEAVSGHQHGLPTYSIVFFFSFLFFPLRGASAIIFSFQIFFNVLLCVEVLLTIFFIKIYQKSIPTICTPKLCDELVRKKLSSISYLIKFCMYRKSYANNLLFQVVKKELCVKVMMKIYL